MVRLKQRYIVLFVLFLTVFGLGQTTTQTASSTPVKARRLAMWKASSPTATVYLLGSMHLGDKDFYPLPDVVESAFKASKVLVVEVNLNKVDQVATIKSMQQTGFYPDGDSLSKHLPKDLSDALDDFCRKNSFPRSMMEIFKPWVVAVTVEVLALQKAGEDPTLGIDMHFLKESKEPQRIDELETADFQMNALASGTEQEQEEMLADTLKELSNPKEHILEIKDTYLSGDPDLIQKFMEQHSTPKSFYKRLVDDRNGSMAERIEGYLKGKDQCFVVVGAAHLVGDKGIVRLLQHKNYKVELVDAQMPATP
jgi:uncharacterized protein